MQPDVPIDYGPGTDHSGGQYGPRDYSALFPQPIATAGEGVRIVGYGNQQVIHADPAPTIEEAATVAAATCSYAWTPTKTGNSGGYDLLTLNVGSVSGATTKIGGVDILTNPTLQVPDTADTTQIIYLEIPVTKTKTANDFVYGCTITGGVATVEVGTSLPTSSQTTRYHELFRWRNGALLNQVGRYNVYVWCRDDGTSTDVGVFTILTAG